MITKTITFPKAFDRLNGKTSCSKTYDSINQCLYLLINSSKGELFGDPNFGSDVSKYIYEVNNNVLNELVKTSLLKAIVTYEPRIVVTENDITLVNKDTTLEITINYILKEEGSFNSYSVSLMKEVSD